MLHRTTHTPTDISRRSHAQRRLRRAAAQRLFCTTNGCTTFLVPDEEGQRLDRTPTENEDDFAARIRSFAEANRRHGRYGVQVILRDGEET